MKSPKPAVFFLLMIVVAGVWGAQASPSSSSAPPFRAITPAGYEVLELRPSRASLALLGIIECPELEGATRSAEGLNSQVRMPDGSFLKNFPQQFSFRVTASLRKALAIPASGSTVTSVDPEKFLLNLKFRLRIYDGLETRDVEPAFVQVIGMPADVPYDERVYRVSFAVGKLPVTARCILQVLSPDGQVLTHFPFDLL